MITRMESEGEKNGAIFFAFEANLDPCIQNASFTGLANELHRRK